MAFLAHIVSSLGGGSVGGRGGATAFRAVASGAAVFRGGRPFGASASSPASSSGAAARFVRPSTTCLGSTIEASSASSSRTAEATAVVEHPSFEVVRTDTVPEYGAACTLYRHKKSGAELLSLATDDDNKCFGITFRTPPRDSTGVPHILEHSVLCGSRKYTTKDPFVQLLQGSLQTFLNAFTYPDRTCYVVASQNTKDFYNLINVYSDAVFHPRAVSDPMVHAQEGWHLELEKMDDPLTYKGVVYNEMKGVYSSPDSLLQREAQQSIFPDNAYGVDSGGDPAVIPDLSFEQFAEFHSKYYHPANSRIFFAGDDDVSRRLEIMDEYLSDFEDSPESKPGSIIEWQKKRYVDPVRVRYPYPVSDKGDEGEPDTHLTMTNWLLNDRPMTATEEITLTVLDHLLTGTTSSILRKTLMESGLGDAITGGGLSDELMQATFSMGLKGVRPENVDKVEELVMDTLRKVAEEGFPEDALAASMNTVEFQLREFNTGSFPKGLSLMLGSMSKWVYDRDPTEALKFEEPLAELKASIAGDGSKVFQDMIREFLLENTHRTTVEMYPSKSLEEEQLTEEKERLAKIKASLNEEDLQGIIDKTIALKKIQAAEDPPEARATIPSLDLSDLKREVTEYPIRVSENESNTGVTVVRHELGSTSGIVYASMAVDVSGISFEDVPLLPLLTHIMMETGAGEYDSVALSRRIGMHTGGVSVSSMIVGVNQEGAAEGAVTGGEHFITKLMITGKSTSDKTDELFSIFDLILRDARLDSQAKIIEMLREDKSDKESTIQGSGHSIANARIRSRYSVIGYINEKMSGVSSLDTVKELLDQAKNDFPALLARLEKMRNTILDQSTCRDGMILDLTGDAAVFEKIESSVQNFLTKLPGDSQGSKLQNFYSKPHPWAVQAKEEMATSAPLVDEGFIVPTQVSYVGKGGRLYNVGEIVSGTSSVVSRFLGTGYMWDNVRVIGGAYGGFCQFQPRDGIFSFLSYRDPNLAGTIDVYDGACKALLASAKDMETDPDALATAIIGAIGDMDGALSPNQKGSLQFKRWLTRESPEQRQKFRDEVLNTKPSDFKEFAERLKALKDPSLAVVSSRAAFEDASKAGKTFTLKDIM
ncbi:hypothetical protein ACHAW5_000095 [Stephanodiscus triporus]|uniref:Peptidase M16C associated domain-containing protein n=1 Tax=Stephanodiscus triporus TaxID=2934178 RepID=A0ABD3P5Y3_9STRA